MDVAWIAPVAYVISPIATRISPIGVKMQRGEAGRTCPMRAASARPRRGPRSLRPRAETASADARRLLRRARFRALGGAGCPVVRRLEDRVGSGAGGHGRAAGSASSCGGHGRGLLRALLRRPALHAKAAGVRRRMRIAARLPWIDAGWVDAGWVDAGWVESRWGAWLGAWMPAEAMQAGSHGHGQARGADWLGGSGRGTTRWTTRARAWTCSANAWPRVLHRGRAASPVG